MRRVFILDDIRDEVAAYYGAGLKVIALAEDAVTLARTFDEGIKVIAGNERYDLWVLDHDLGCYDDSNNEQSGYDFLMYCVYSMSDKVPDQLVSCSANPIGRERIVELFGNWKKFKS